MKLGIVGASNFVNRMFEACGSYQWAREFLKNSLEAGATQVEFGVEWQAVEKYGVYRRTIIDDGSGMGREELLRFFSTLGEGAKKIGGIHDNFGVGAKIASLPWNPEGVVVVSYRNGHASMIQIVLEPESGDYELVEFETESGKGCVIDPSTIDWTAAGEVDWNAIRPAWLKEHGTVIVLLGSEEHKDTILGNPSADEQSIKGLSVYLNSRFWDLSKAEVRVAELRSEKKNQWPTSASDKDDERRPNNRTILGARHYLTDIKTQAGSLGARGEVLLDEGRVKAEWYLWSGERPHIHMYARKGGYIGVRYNDELFEISSGKVQFRWFGIVESAVQQNVTVILEPQHYQSDGARWGVHPDQSRNRLIFTGDGEKGVGLPLADWGVEFAEEMPDEIFEAIRKARGDGVGSIDDEEYRKRLQDKFGSRWTMKALVAPNEKPLYQKKAAEPHGVAEVFEEIDPVRPRSREKRRKSLKVLLPKANPGSARGGVEREVPVDVPRYVFSHKDNFQEDWHLAAWVPNDPEGPTVELNTDSPILDEAIKYHQEQYAEIYAEDVAKTIRQVFGEVAVSKIAHSQKLIRNVAEEVLDSEYRNEKALTIALMGLLAEESLIAQRLGKFGRKKDKAAA
jgi:hypothetical protein